MRFDVRQDGRLTAVWDQVINVVTLWQEGGAGILRCSSCAGGAHLRDWQFEPAWAFGHLCLVFWNWPPLADQFISDVSHQLGHRVAVIVGKQ